MTLDTTIEADCDGMTLEKLSELIAAREKYLQGETTENAVTATAINILSSLRADTKVVNVGEAAEDGYYADKSADAVAGFKSEKGKNRGYRVVRAAGGHEMTSVNKVNLAGKYQRGENVSVYIVIFKYHDFTRGETKEKMSRFYVIAKNKADVDKWAKDKLEKYIKIYKSMARWLIGQAQSRVFRATRGSFGDEISHTARDIALQHLVVEVGGDGFSSGNFYISVEDSLDYATLALKHGESSLEFAMQKAANRTAGIINTIGFYRLDEPIPTPFPEIAGKR